jgi:hypothetical protein
MKEGIMTSASSSSSSSSSSSINFSTAANIITQMEEKGLGITSEDVVKLSAVTQAVFASHPTAEQLNQLEQSLAHLGANFVQKSIAQEANEQMDGPVAPGGIGGSAHLRGQLTNQIALAIREIRTRSQKLPDAIVNHPAFHQKALTEGIKMVQDAMKKNTVAAANLPDELRKFTRDYSKDMLMQSNVDNCYLLRKSSVPDYGNYHFFALQTKQPQDNQEAQINNHLIVYNKETEKWHMTTNYAGEGREKINTENMYIDEHAYDTVDEAIRGRIGDNFQPVRPLKEEQFNQYMSLYMSSMPNSKL